MWIAKGWRRPLSHAARRRDGADHVLVAARLPRVPARRHGRARTSSRSAFGGQLGALFVAEIVLGGIVPLFLLGRASMRARPRMLLARAAAGGRRHRPEPRERRAVRHGPEGADALDRAGSLRAVPRRVGASRSASSPRRSSCSGSAARHLPRAARSRPPSEARLRMARDGLARRRTRTSSPWRAFMRRWSRAMASIDVVEAPVPRWDDYLADFHDGRAAPAAARAPRSTSSPPAAMARALIANLAAAPASRRARGRGAQSRRRAAEGRSRGARRIARWPVRRGD